MASLTPSGAKAMDSTLPLIARVTDPETSLLAFCSGLVPLLITVLLAL